MTDGWTDFLVAYATFNYAAQPKIKCNQNSQVNHQQFSNIRTARAFHSETQKVSTYDDGDIIKPHL